MFGEGEGGGAFLDAKIPHGADPPRYTYNIDLGTRAQVVRSRLNFFPPRLLFCQNVMLRQLLGQTLAQV